MPTIQEQAARMTEQAVETIFRTARHVPDDKLNWSPMGAARPALAQLVEVALSPFFFIPMIKGEPMHMDEAAQKRRAEMEASITTLEAAHQTAVDANRQLAETILGVPDSTLSENRRLPFRGGMDMLVSDLIFLPYWNIVYHTGQINYIQTLLGDSEMH